MSLFSGLGSCLSCPWFDWYLSKTLSRDDKIPSAHSLLINELQILSIHGALNSDLLFSPQDHIAEFMFSPYYVLERLKQRCWAIMELVVSAYLLMRLYRFSYIYMPLVFHLKIICFKNFIQLYTWEDKANINCSVIAVSQSPLVL